MFRHGQIGFFAAGICFMGAIASANNFWIFILNAVLCIINIYLGSYIIRMYNNE